MNSSNMDVFGGNYSNSDEKASNTAPEAITKAVACLPPDQMFELMKQMKLCIQNNPQEARIMLIKNPPLAYALLQAQVVMNITDPAEAVQYLTKQPAPAVEATTSNTAVFNAPPKGVPAPLSEPVIPHVPVQKPVPISVPVPVPVTAPGPVQHQGPVTAHPPPIFGAQDNDFRPVMPNDPRQRAMSDFDMRRNAPMTSFNQTVELKDPRQRPADPRFEVNRPIDPRIAKGAVPPPRPIQHPPMTNFAPPTAPTDKTALIRQVLQLSDEQIALLPPEQRASIMVLKAQIAKSAQR